MTHGFLPLSAWLAFSEYRNAANCRVYASKSDCFGNKNGGGAASGNLRPHRQAGPRIARWLRGCDLCQQNIAQECLVRRLARCFDTPDPKGLPMPGRGQMRVIPFIRSPHRCVRLSEQSCSLVELTQVFGRSLLINLVCQYHQNLSAPMFRKRTGPRPRWMILSRLN